jgi:transposase
LDGAGTVLLDEVLPMDISPLLPASACLQVDTCVFDETTHKLTLTLTSTQDALLCPLCQACATRIHSHYTRTLADLAWAELPIQLIVRLRKAFCPSPDCQRTIFTERLPALAAPYARRTTRLATAQRRIGFALGGNAGAELSLDLALPTSQDTLLRLVQCATQTPSITPRLIGVDDFAFRKGHTYGTIIIDLETHRPIDLLPDRTAETLAQWLREHPGIEVISRDRASAYAEGAHQGAPEAMQVADRFHLIGNSADALIRVFEQQHRQITAALSPAEPAPPATAAPAQQPQTTQAAQQQHICQERRQSRYEAVWDLHRQGWTNRAIAEQLHLHRDTVSKYLSLSELPPYQTPNRPSRVLGPFLPYILERWNAGCQNSNTLLQELIARGYQGSPSTLFNYLTQLRKLHGLPPRRRAPGTVPSADGRPARPLTPRSAAWLFLKAPEKLKRGETEQMEQIRSAHPDLDRAVQLTQDFASIVRERRHQDLDGWLECAEQSELVPFRNFAISLRRDYAAVQAGVREQWNNGATEGHVNRLKMLKRQLYGRASFSLLRQRVLAIRPRAAQEADHQKCE